MKIGILTYYRVANFGANLQALSTFFYLKNHGHEPIFIHYMPRELYEFTNDGSSVQKKEHLHFIDSVIGKNQTELIHDRKEIDRVISLYNIEALIIGSDALLQHHPLLERIKVGKRKPFYIQKISADRMYPNAFWGCDIECDIPKALMSVSSQNSRYQYFDYFLKKRMRNSLSKFCYLSVRDEWTKAMVQSITGNDIDVTPDPVFCFNKNCNELILNAPEVRSKFNLPKNYVLVSLGSQCLSIEQLVDLKDKLNKKGKVCVALPMPTGMLFKHPFDYEIKCPLNSIDWYNLICNASAYIGSNMHPIVVCLHNAVPCYSIDYWVNTNFFGRAINDGSGKVEHIMKTFGVLQNRCIIEGGKCTASINEILNALEQYPISMVHAFSEKYQIKYEQMMQNILKSFKV